MIIRLAWSEGLSSPLIQIVKIQDNSEFQIRKMASENTELLLKCLELTKHIVDKNMFCCINVKMGEGKDEFVYNFNNGLTKRLSPSQEKRNFLRKQEYLKNKVKDEFEEQVNDSEGKIMIKQINDIEKSEKGKKSKVIKFKVAAHMRVAAQKVLETAVSKLSWTLSKKINWFKEESKWDLEEKVDGEFSGFHTFGIEIDNDDPTEIILEHIKKNWKQEPFPAKLIQAWVH
jgi:hypothetical protein